MNMLSSCRPAPPDREAAPADIVPSVQAVLLAPEEELDYARAKVALDRLIDPAADADWTFAELDRLTAAARRLAGPHPAEQDKLRAVRTVIYQSGPWNGFRPFDYDHEDFRVLRVKLLSHYLTTRRGNCVSMPILFLILADRLGLDMSLAIGVTHLFVRWRREDGQIVNLETTSGASPARDVWFLQCGRLNERGVASGFYRRSLSKHEGIAVMVLTLVEHLIAERRFREALAVTELILRCNPRDGMAWANQGQACFHIMGAEYLDRFGSELLIPVQLRAGYLTLRQRNHHAFATAKRLGWEPNSVPGQGRV
jgi:regulator of sirC expression with transglutaminase-like and TPR domain